MFVLRVARAHEVRFYGAPSGRLYAGFSSCIALMRAARSRAINS
jgi:hypothetical protein